MCGRQLTGEYAKADPLRGHDDRKPKPVGTSGGRADRLLRFWLYSSTTSG